MNGTPIAGTTVAVGPTWTTLFRATASPVGSTAVNDGQAFALASLRVVSGTAEVRQRGTHDSAANLHATPGSETELPQYVNADGAITLYGRRGTGNLVEARGVGAEATVRFNVIAK
jgi:hypothetical protein